jgi:two-component sensor histidine kinase
MKEILQDSLYNIQRINLAQNLEAKYQRKQQDQRIANMSIQDELNQARLTQQRWLMISAFLLATIFAGLFFKFSQQNKKIKEQNNVISKALSEKEVLLKEIHHRVKNNLQVISSLLGLQSRKIKDKAALNAINEGRSRVQSMSLIHQNLYKKNNLTGIEIKKYLEQLCNNLFATYNISNEQISLETNIENIILDVDSIVPIGLILNELITNALKHAFPNNRPGIINIDISKNNEGLIMSVSDNGVGMKSDDPFTGSDSFGYHLIKAFQRKLNADLEITGTNGTSISMLIRNYKIAA